MTRKEAALILEMPYVAPILWMAEVRIADGI